MINIKKILFNKIQLLMRNKRLMVLITISVILLFNSKLTFAVVTCTPFNASIPRTDTIPLAPINISAGVDMPNGTIIYRGSWFGSLPGYQITCNTSTVPESFNYTFNLGINSAPLPLSSWNSSPFAGRVYETGIPGIGVSISDGNQGVTQSIPYANAGNRVYEMIDNTIHHNVINSTRYINLIKTGPITPGSYPLSSANLPSAKLYFDNIPGMSAVVGFPITSNILQFQGTLNVSAQTCTTPDVNVPMGTYDANADLSGIGSSTPWIKVNLVLLDCPTFYGYYNNANIAMLFDYGNGGASNIPSSTNNTISARFTPNTTIIDNTSGIMSIDPSTLPAATGIGIQLGWGNGTPAPITFSLENSQSLPKDGSKNIDLPLYARYIQTESNVTPGKANGKVTFTINYN